MSKTYEIIFNIVFTALMFFVVLEWSALLTLRRYFKEKYWESILELFQFLDCNASFVLPFFLLKQTKIFSFPYITAWTTFRFEIFWFF